ncbi:hypothetical protein MYU51_017413 [Penicillium brevicompactum]|uniref:uncharacterized protein n=1 Tax=Penicillium brevicompactum TaxID=5074 RepID=UPI00253FC4D0|nr:uncharacterized protein N7506_005453 [Penicillium brevicompactum]KAJ5337431.1 hypothetical protein N7506_005453 [Penicillium brevicompactum]
MGNVAWVWLLLISVSQLAQSSETARSHWQRPNGDDKNFKETYSIGDSLQIQWAGWDSSYTNQWMNNETKANLYVNAWNSDYSSFSKILTSSNDISTHGSYDWKVEIDDKYLSDTKEYGFTFIPDGMVYSTDGYRIYSPGIRIQSKSATSSFTPTNVPTTTSKALSSGTDGLSTGAKAGIGVSIGMVGLALLTTFGFFLLRWRHRPSSREVTGVRESSHLGSAQTPADGFYQKAKPPPQELSIGSESPAELASTLER